MLHGFLVHSFYLGLSFFQIHRNRRMSANVQIEESWKKVLEDQFRQPYFQNIAHFLRREKAAGTTVYPPGSLIFNAFNSTPFYQVKAVILGQDPYHNPGEAMGLCFSVPKGVRVPPSLKRIFRELKDDVGVEIPDHGDLTKWAGHGVFLLNAMLTVEKNKPGSHRDIGWQNFTDAVIRKLSGERKHLVFLLWGNFAKKKKNLIDTSKHLVLESPHPSPLAGDGFLGNHHFSQTNDYLTQHGLTPIDWHLD